MLLAAFAGKADSTESSEENQERMMRQAVRANGVANKAVEKADNAVATAQQAVAVAEEKTMAWKQDPSKGPGGEYFQNAVRELNDAKEVLSNARDAATKADDAAAATQQALDSVVALTQTSSRYEVSDAMKAIADALRDANNANRDADRANREADEMLKDTIEEAGGGSSSDQSYLQGLFASLSSILAMIQAKLGMGGNSQFASSDLNRSGGTTSLAGSSPSPYATFALAQSRTDSPLSNIQPYASFGGEPEGESDE
jgi:cell division septum initiation protein DivIVA